MFYIYNSYQYVQIYYLMVKFRFPSCLPRMYRAKGIKFIRYQIFF